MILAQSNGGGGGEWVLMGLLVAVLVFVAWVAGKHVRRRKDVATELERDRLEADRELENLDSDALVDRAHDAGVFHGEIPGEFAGAERVPRANGNADPPVPGGGVSEDPDDQ